MRQLLSLFMAVVIAALGVVSHTALTGPGGSAAHAATPVVAVSVMAGPMAHGAHSGMEHPADEPSHDLGAGCAMGGCAMICGFIAPVFECGKTASARQVHGALPQPLIAGVKTAFDPPPPKG